MRLFQSIFNRLNDIILSLILFSVTLPFILVFIPLIKLDSNGPILYKQKRVGLNGKYFTMYKFRSMQIDAEKNGPVWAKEKDSRVTTIGRFMRLTRLDEVPQVFNILKDEMSFIGPRPERPEFVCQLSKIIPEYNKRHNIKPGLTGWAQVKYSYGSSIEDTKQKLIYDLFYIRNRCFILDLTILFLTIGVVIFQKGAR